MAYPKTLSASLLRRMRPLLRRVASLTEGKSLSLEGPHDHLVRIRYNFLVWAKFQREAYRTTLKGETLTITLCEAETEPASPISQPEANDNPSAFDPDDFALEELLDCETSAEVHEVCTSAGLSASETEAAHTAWMRINA